MKKGEEVPAELTAKLEAAEKVNEESAQKTAAAEEGSAPTSPPPGEEGTVNTAAMKEKVRKKLQWFNAAPPFLEVRLICPFL